MKFIDTYNSIAMNWRNRNFRTQSTLYAFLVYLTLSLLLTTIVPYANGFYLDETPSNLSFHPDPNCLTPKQHFCVTCCKQRWHLGITFASSVCPSVCPSVRLYVRTSHFCPTSHFLSGQTFCPVILFLSECNNSSSTDAIEMKLHMWIDLKWVKSHAQDP